MKRTKIVATVSDLNYGKEFLTGLYERGVNVMRLNTAHQTPEDTAKVVAGIRDVSNNIAVLVDTKGPEIRTNPKVEGEVPVKTGDVIKVRCDGPDAPSTKEAVQVNYDGFVRDVPVGTSILIDDGYLEIKVIDKNEEESADAEIAEGDSPVLGS